MSEFSGKTFDAKESREGVPVLFMKESSEVDLGLYASDVLCWRRSADMDCIIWSKCAFLFNFGRFRYPSVCEISSDISEKRRRGIMSSLSVLLWGARTRKAGDLSVLPCL